MAIDLYKRSIIVVIGVPLVLFLLTFGVLNHLPFFLLILAVVLVSSLEYQNMLKQRWITDYKLLFLITAGILCLGFWIQTFAPASGLKDVLLVAGLIAFIVPQFFKNSFLESLAYMGHYLFGLVFITYGMSHLVLVINMANGLYYIFLMLAAVWLSDSAAYVAGILVLGEKRHRIPLKVSPNKSWEGYAAGLVGAVAGVFLANLIFGHTASVNLGYSTIEFSGKIFGWWQSVLVGLFISIFAGAGDLAESVLKRSVNIKDSGTLLPGHGGIMDRVDSFFLLAPAFYYLLKFCAG